MTVLGYRPPLVIRRSCAKCSGLGAIVAWWRSDSDMTTGADTVMCPSCNGAGVIRWTYGVSLPPRISRRR